MPYQHVVAASTTDIQINDEHDTSFKYLYISLSFLLYNCIVHIFFFCRLVFLGIAQDLQIILDSTKMTPILGTYKHCFENQTSPIGSTGSIENRSSDW